MEGSARADPGTGAVVGPDQGGDPVLFGLRSLVGQSGAAVCLPRGGHDLVGATCSAGGVQGRVVAPGLTHDDVGRDRIGTPEVRSDLFFRPGSTPGLLLHKNGKTSLRSRPPMRNVLDP